MYLLHLQGSRPRRRQHQQQQQQQQQLHHGCGKRQHPHHHRMCRRNFAHLFNRRVCKISHQFFSLGGEGGWNGGGGVKGKGS